MSPSRFRTCCSIGCPEVLCGIGAPWPPGFGSRKKTRRGRLLSVKNRCAAKQPDIRSGKCVRFPEGAQCNILRRPFPHTPESAQSRDGLFDRSERAKQVWISCRRLGEGL